MRAFCRLVSVGLISFLVHHGLQADELDRVSSDGIQFDLQRGLTLERAVPKSLVKWPVVVDWDFAGRLVVVESGGASRPIEEHNKKLLHRIVRLQDTDADGIFDERILAADKLPFTEGVLCLGNSILAAAPPHIWKLTDVDGDGYCEEREVWFDGQTITGCANDLHGPYLGVDGWIYWCKGAFALQTHELTDGSQLKDRAAHIFRRRLDGGAIESVISGGMDNPVEVAFTPAGDRFFTSTFLQHPRGGKRDGIGHAVYGAVFGKDHSAIDGVVRTGPLMPIMTHLGPSAPSGLICLERGNQIILPTSSGSRASVLVAAQFNLHRVSAHRLEPDGAGYRTTDHVLLETEKVDFHPTDILEDEAGALLVVDTGGWYDLCCPTSRVDQKVAGGGIYRLRRNEIGKAELPKPAPVDWRQVTPRQCVEMLDDPRPWIRRQAALRVNDLGDQVLPEIESMLSRNGHQPSPMDLIWALSGVGTEAALTVLLDHISTNQDDSRIDQHLAACHILGLHRFAPARNTLQERCEHSDLRLVRAAVEALGRLKNPDSVEVLMQVAGRAETDALLRHSLVYALIEIGDNRSLRSYLQDENDAATRAIALLALDALDDATISGDALDAIHSEQPLLVATAVEILKRHPDWSAQAREHLVRISASTDRTAVSAIGLDALQSLLRAWHSQPVVHAFVAEQLQRPELGLEQKLGLLDAWQGLELPPAFDQPLSSLLSLNTELVAGRLSKFKLSAEKHRRLVAALKNQIENVVAASQYSKAQVLLGALPADSGYSNDQLQEYLLRSDSFSLLLKLRIDSSLAQQVMQRLDSISAADLPDAVSTISCANKDLLDLQLLERMSSLPASRMLDVGLLTSLYRDRSAPLRRAAAQLEEQLHSPPDDVAAVLQAKLASLPEGDAVRGLRIFHGSKANCAACHVMGYVGGEIGPELTQIGRTRTREALLEAILFPDLRIEQGFRPLKILTVDGQVVIGLATREAGIVHLQTNVEKRVSVPEDEIESEQPSDVSIMPTGMLEQLSDQELADLLSLLEAAK